MLKIHVCGMAIMRANGTTCTSCTHHVQCTMATRNFPPCLRIHTHAQQKDFESICMFNGLAVKMYIHWLGADVAYLWACCYETFIRSTHSKQMKGLKELVDNNYICVHVHTVYYK